MRYVILVFIKYTRTYEDGGLDYYQSTRLLVMRELQGAESAHNLAPLLRVEPSAPYRLPANRIVVNYLSKLKLTLCKATA